MLGIGCAVEPRPFVHTVPYQSSVACVSSGQACPWNRLEQEARFSALVRCLLAGATVIEREESEIKDSDMITILAATPPRTGFEHRTVEGDGQWCQVTEQQCIVRNNDVGTVTWAGCDTERMVKSELRGGDSISQADLLNESIVVTGSLNSATDQISIENGMNGPDHFYTINLSQPLILEAAVAANSSKMVSKPRTSSWLASSLGPSRR